MAAKYLVMNGIFPRIFALSCALAIVLTGCGSPPPSPASRLGVAWTSRSNTHLILDSLPLKDYPTLKKFHKLREVQYWREASDQKLEALARAGLTNLTCVTMNWGGELVTDRGIEALTSLPSLNSLGLEGSRITDAGMEMIATRLRPREVNAANCPNLTARGLMKLVQAETLESIQFSSENLTPDEALRIVRSLRIDTRCDIVDPTQKFKTHEGDLRATARSKSLEFYIRSKGSLQVRDRAL